jgi:vacuolar-type H+-ATPase subunit D/Vma8
MPAVATRSELLLRRSQIGLARQGRDLIWDKRTTLLQKFQRLEINLLAELDALAGQAAAARQALEVATADLRPVR